MDIRVRKLFKFYSNYSLAIFKVDELTTKLPILNFHLSSWDINVTFLQ